MMGSEELEVQSVKEEKPEIIPRKRKRLRNLAVNEEPSTSFFTRQVIGICLLVAVAIGLATTHPHIIDDFIRSYREQYHQMVYGESNYCTRSFNFKDLLTTVREHIYGQEVALDQIEAILKGHRNLTSIAIVGTTGVGKTYFFNLLRSHYPWLDNVQHYAWSTFIERDERKYQRIWKFIENLSNCGYNLILIDDLTPQDKFEILQYQKLIEKSLSKNDRPTMKLIVIYVFNVLRYSSESREAYEENVKSLQHLGSIKTVNFKDLTSLDVKKCIKKTASDLNASLSQNQIVNILQSIDTFQVGCKNVHAKITKYNENVN